MGFVSLLREHFVRLPTRSFVLDCSLRMGGPRDSGGEGVSISYGDIPEAALKEGVSVGERGAGRGLRLLLRTYVHSQLVVMWDNEVRHTVAVPGLRTPAHGEFAPLHIRLDNKLLQVWWKGVAVVPALVCEWYAPRPHWTWAIGARAGQRADDHWLANLTMLSSHYAVDVGAVSIDVSLNDQDYTYQHQYYAFYGSPELSAFSPTSGPADGGTQVTLRGGDLADGLHYTCRFGNAGHPEDVQHYGFTPGANDLWSTPLELASGVAVPWGEEPSGCPQGFEAGASWYWSARAFPLSRLPVFIAGCMAAFHRMRDDDPPPAVQLVNPMTG